MLQLFLSMLVGAEGIALLAGAFFFFSQIFIVSPSSLSGAIVIFLVTVLLALALCALSIATYRRKSGVSGAIITWQILQIGVATSFLRAEDVWNSVGYVLLALSGVTILIFTISQLRKGK